MIQLCAANMTMAKFFILLGLFVLARSLCQPANCDDENPCTIDACVNNACTHTPQANGTSCDDNKWCNGRDICQNGECIHLGDPCARGSVCSNVCNEEKLSCISPAGTPCDDGNFCNGLDKCDGSGFCVSSGSPCPGCTCSNTNQTCYTPEGNVCAAVLGDTQLSAGDRSGSSNSVNPVVAGAVGGSILVAVLVGVVVGLLVMKRRRLANAKQEPKTDMEADGASSVVRLPNTGGLPGVGRMMLTPVAESSPKGSPLAVRRAVAYTAQTADRVRMENLATSIEEVEMGKALGSGHFGEVFYGMWHKPEAGGQTSSIELALKKLHRPDKFENFRDEASTLRQLQHSNIVRYFGVFVDHNRHEMYLATEYMKSGSLVDLLQILGDKISEDQMVEMVLGAALGMSFLEKSNVVHRNLSCRNLLVAMDDSGHYVVKVSDFGNAKCVTNDGGDFVASDIIVPVRWSAPEVLRDNVFSAKSDVFSFGVCMWEIFEKGREPWTDCSDFQVSEWVLRGDRLDRPIDCADDLYDIMSSCWSESPEDRPTFQTIVDSIDRVMRDRMSAGDDDEEEDDEDLEEGEESATSESELDEQAQGSAAARLQSGRMAQTTEDDDGETL